MKFHKLAVFVILLFSSSLWAEEKRHGPSAIEVRVSLGTADEEMKFVPDTLSFERGKYYKLVLHNPSSEDHYFTSDAFATHIFTRKVEVADKSGKTIAEIHGAVNDIELKPGATVEWFFLPHDKGKEPEALLPQRRPREAGHDGHNQHQRPAAFQQIIKTA